MADELSDELLALAGEDSHSQKSRKRQASSAKQPSGKRRKHNMTTDSEAEYESEGEEETEFPLEGKYRDEEDREELLRLSEIRREAILSKRMEDMQKQIERKNLERMVKSQAAVGGAPTQVDPVANAAKRKHTGVGSTKEKTKTLEALKQKRQAKESRRANKGHDSESPTPRRRSSDTASSSSEDEEGQVYRQDEASDLDGVQIKGEEKLTVDDLNKARITRDMLENQCMSPHFEEYVKGGWVRLLVGMDQGQNVYRICEIVEVSRETTESYMLNNKRVNQMLDLQHGAQIRAFPMMKTSCAPFTDREFDRLMRTCEAEKVKPPTKSKLEKKAEQIRAIDSRPRTDAEISQMIARQKELRNQPSHNELYSKRATLNMQRTLALKRSDRAEIDKLNAEIAEIDEIMKGSTPTEATTGTSQLDALARLNERNRRLNIESMRKAEAEAARRKREAANGTKPLDLSARVKTVVKTHFDSRAGTPGTPGPAATPAQTTTTTTAEETAIVNGSKVDVLAQSVVIEDLF